MQMFYRSHTDVKTSHFNFQFFPEKVKVIFKKQSSEWSDKNLSAISKRMFKAL